MRKIKLISIFLILLFSLVGCQNSTLKSDNNIVYNSSVSNSFVDGGKYIYGNVSDNNNNFTTIIKNKSTEKVKSFIRDPFFDDKKNVTYVESVYIDNDSSKGYYIKNRRTDNEAGFSIIEFDLSKFNKKEIYTERFVLDKKVFLGLNEISDIKASKENDFSENITSNLGTGDKISKFFVFKDYIYLIQQNGIFKVNIKNKKETLLINEYDIKNVSFDGEYIYYIDNKYDVYKYSITTSAKVKLMSNKSSYLMLTESKVIYTNLKDNNRIYMMNKDGSNNHRICTSRADKVNYDDEFIYYSNMDDNQCLYRIKYDGSENKKMTDRAAYFIFTFKDYNKLYIWSNDTNSGGIKSFSVDKKDFHMKLLEF
ncbi:hypothetical protein SDC9_133057 [bioreactor metagenome]|uniref:Prolow-density lipoprotein receptor-related protein 1-like beta-propeller domain-containing protein n=1 Tax=bioreactor metagenome TaxID=1076179 RepID=A0A645D9H1_9ZZZZ